MTTREIFRALENKGAQILYDFEREQLVVRPKKGNPLEPELLAEMRAHRGEILQRIIPPETCGLKHVDWVFRLGHIELARQKSLAETERKEVGGGPASAQADAAQEVLPL